MVEGRACEISALLACYCACVWSEIWHGEDNMRPHFVTGRCLDVIIEVRVNYWRSWCVRARFARFLAWYGKLICVLSLRYDSTCVHALIEILFFVVYGRL